MYKKEKVSNEHQHSSLHPEGDGTEVTEPETWGIVWVLLCSHLAQAALGGLWERLLYSLKLVCPSQQIWIVLRLHTRHPGSCLCNLRSAVLPRSPENSEHTRAARLSLRLCHVCFTVQWVPRNFASDVFFLVE